MFKKFNSAITKLTSVVFFAGLIACGDDGSSSSDNPQAPGDAEPVLDSSSSLITPESSSSVTEALESSSSDVASDISSSDTSSADSEQTPSSSSAVIPDSAPESSSSSITTAPQSSSVETPADPVSSSTDSNLLWAEEFSGSAINTDVWTFETGATGWGNNELQYYTDRTENAYVTDGLLHIRADRELFERAPYTSARLITKGKFSFTYGTIEARIALPKGKGIWPAFWMLGENIDKVSWPACGEVDIIEAVNDESVVYGTHHWAHEGQHAEYGNSTKEYYGTNKQLDITEFHTYKTVWTEQSIAMYVDDFKYQEIDITLPKNADGTVDVTSEMGTFHKPFFFILNVAVGGTWPGFDIDDTQFPNEMIVDFIRVYKN